MGKRIINIELNNYQIPLYWVSYSGLSTIVYTNFLEFYKDLPKVWRGLGDVKELIAKYQLPDLKPEINKSYKNDWTLYFEDEEGVSSVATRSLRRRRRDKKVKPIAKLQEINYKSRESSVLFLTITDFIKSKVWLSCLINRKSFPSVLMKNLKHFVEFQSYLWFIEVSPNLHFHYHFVLEMPRLRVRGSELPDYLKLDKWLYDRWTNIQFVRKSVISYLMTYLYKEWPISIWIEAFDQIRPLRTYGSSSSSSSSS